MHHGLQRSRVADGSRQVNHHVYPGEDGQDGGQVGDVGLTARQARDGATAEGVELVEAAQVAAEDAADEPAQAGHEHARHSDPRESTWAGTRPPPVR